MKVSEDGLEYTFHQSWLGDALLCLERGRAVAFDDLLDGPTDATATGTALHAGAEVILYGGTEAEAFEWAHAVLDVEMGLPGFRFVKVMTEATMRKHVDLTLAEWIRDVYPQLGDPLMIEHRFKVLLDERDGIQIWLGGTIDFGDEFGLWDWKTANDDRKYGSESWKLKRWNVQPTIYTFAAHAEGFYDAPVQFSWAAATKGSTSKIQRVDTERGPEHWEFLKAQLWQLVALHRSGLERWPLNDQHALCSDKWCANWSTCPKGQAA